MTLPDLYRDLAQSACVCPPKAERKLFQIDLYFHASVFPQFNGQK
jgi:hypothetical protein